LGKYALAYAWFLAADALIDSYQEAAARLRERIDRFNGANAPDMTAVRQQLYILLQYVRPYRQAMHMLRQIALGHVRFKMEERSVYYDTINHHLTQTRDDIEGCLTMLDGMSQDMELRQGTVLTDLVSRLTILGIVLATIQVIIGVLSIDLSRLFPHLSRGLGVVIVFVLFACVTAIEVHLLRKKGYLK
jgi:Mg2+ and Co2+ transporter CorA